MVGGAAFVSARLLAPLPHPLAAITAPATLTPAPGSTPLIPLPPQGSFALQVVGNGAVHSVTLAADTVRPIASVAKTMTALVVLEQHPLGAAERGPLLTMTAQDQFDYQHIGAAGGSVAPVRAGEQLSERDLLLGLMLPSANNMALTLARWVDGTVPAFVARLNARALALGMLHTHFADPDGLDPQTTSTPNDLVVLGSHALADPSLVEIVSTQNATLPDGTVIDNLDILLRTRPEWVGVKTGWTPNAGGCLLFAARRSLAPGSPPITVVGAVLDQAPDPATDAAHPELGSALRVAAAATDAAYSGFAAVTLTADSLAVSGTARSADGSTVTALRASGADHVVVLALGDTLTSVVRLRSLSTPLSAGDSVGSITVSRQGTTIGRWDLVAQGGIPDPSPLSRLLHW